MKNVWKGSYTYFDDEENESKPIGFEIHAELVSGSFHGKVSEEEFTKLTGDKATVKGFVENDFISFVKTYPYAWWIEDEQYWINKELPGHDCNYRGFYSEADQEWSGEWEVITEKGRIGNYQEEFEAIVLTGSWKMKQV
ncbi:MAG: hypothetical protein ACFHU9_03875 [Fluviicola sp.]